MPEVILPCPACGSVDLRESTVTGEPWYICCCGCGMVGPYGAGVPEAVTAWNALPRALTWTHEPPKVAGWYWFSMGKGHAVCLLVCADGKAKLAKDHFTDADMLGGEWAGPIAPPVEG